VEILRGPVLWPVGPNRLVAHRDAVVGASLQEPHAPRRGEAEPERGLILPAFGDWHFHWVQRSIAGQASDGREPLLDWLRRRAWPVEERMSSAQASHAAVEGVVRELAEVGTAAGAAYSSPHAHTAADFLGAAGAGFVCGPAVMTAGEPESLVRPVASYVAELDRLHARFGPRLAVAPRFALSCDASSLAALGRFARDRGLPVQTHLSENVAEVAAVGRAFPGARDPLEVYEQAGLVGPRTLLGHAIHVSDDELARIAAAGACVVHCPTSNRALGSGRMPLERLRRAGVRWVLGTDTGAGPSPCMLDVVCGAIDAHRDAAPLDPVEAFHRATLGRDAVAAGRTESDIPCGARPGAIVVAPPDGLDLAKPDPRTWLDALLDHWRRHRALAVLRVVPWHGPAPKGPASPRR
jgi:guanine deaminase